MNVNRRSSDNRNDDFWQKLSAVILLYSNGFTKAVLNTIQNISSVGNVHYSINFSWKLHESVKNSSNGNVLIKLAFNNTLELFTSNDWT